MRAARGKPLLPLLLPLPPARRSNHQGASSDTGLRVCLACTTLCSSSASSSTEALPVLSKYMWNIQDRSLLRENACLKRKPAGGNGVGRSGGGGKGAGRRGQRKGGQLLIRANRPLLPLALRGMEHRTTAGEPICVDHHLGPRPVLLPWLQRQTHEKAA